MNVIGEGPLSADDRAALRELVGTGRRHNVLMSPPLLLSELAGLLDAADERDELRTAVDTLGRIGVEFGAEIHRCRQALGVDEDTEPSHAAKAVTGALARVMALAEQWRYKGEFGWGAWQEGHGPDETGLALDHAAALIRNAIEADD